jgi:hypothetical protein
LSTNFFVLNGVDPIESQIPRVDGGSEIRHNRQTVQERSHYRGQTRWGLRIGADGTFEADEREENVVAVVRHMRAQGYKIREIVDFLRIQGIRGRRGKAICQTRVFEMIHGGRAKPARRVPAA